MQAIEGKIDQPLAFVGRDPVAKFHAAKPEFVLEIFFVDIAPAAVVRARALDIVEVRAFGKTLLLAFFERGFVGGLGGSFGRRLGLVIRFGERAAVLAVDAPISIAFTNMLYDRKNPRPG